MKAPESLPQISLRRHEWIRLALIGLFAACALARVGPDLLRVVEPIGHFGYVTDADGVVVRAPARVPEGSMRIEPGDRILVGTIPAFDRKPGIVNGESFSYDNRERHVNVERNGREFALRLLAQNETPAGRIATAVKVIAFVVVVCLGGLLVAIRPSIATAAIFAYCLAGTFPDTYLGVAFDRPWREIPFVFGDLLAGIGQPALLLFALCLAFEDRRIERISALVLGVLAAALGALDAYADWRITYATLPAGTFASAYTDVTVLVTAATIACFSLAFVVAHGGKRRRIGWIVASFALAGAARLASTTLYPARIGPWWNDLLLVTTIVPIAAVWFAVRQHRAFNVDLVVSRAVTYAAMTGIGFGLLTVVEEVGSYAFYQNTNFAYGFSIALSLVIGATSGKLKQLIDGLVDRFVFRDRYTRGEALRFIGGYILDAETEDDVYRALLEDAPHALRLTCAGVLARSAEGNYTLAHARNWPDDCVVEIAAADRFVTAMARSRGAMSFTGKESRLVEHAFPNERLIFAAPLFRNRSMSEIVVYGKNESGLGLDSDERELLVRIAANASIALGAIEVERYRARSLSTALQ